MLFGTSELSRGLQLRVAGPLNNGLSFVMWVVMVLFRRQVGQLAGYLEVTVSLACKKFVQSLSIWVRVQLGHWLAYMVWDATRSKSSPKILLAKGLCFYLHYSRTLLRTAIRKNGFLWLKSKSVLCFCNGLYLSRKGTVFDFP